MKKTLLSTFTAIAILALPLSALASPIGVNGKLGTEWNGIAPVSITANASAPVGNFGTPGTQNAAAYNIYTRDDGNYFYVLVTTTDSTAPVFTNLYLDTIASTPGTGSNLGFEVNNDRAFIPGVSGYFTPSSSDFSYATANDNGTVGITAAISNSFFLTDPLGMGFAKTPDGTLVSLHLSQSFGYSVVGGSGNYPAPTELGAAIVSSTTPVPEPPSIEYMLLSGLGVLSFAGRSVLARLRA
jgi:hypothetical protein